MTVALVRQANHALGRRLGWNKKRTCGELGVATNHWTCQIDDYDTHS